jgi:putative membrane protein
MACFFEPTNIIQSHSVPKFTLTLYIIFSVLITSSCKMPEEKKEAVHVVEVKSDQQFADRELQKEADFIAQAISENLMEVQLGQVAQQNGSSPKVKEFGQSMITDHTKSRDALAEIAAKRGIIFPDKPSDKDQNDIDNLRRMTGEAFDQAYIKFMLEEHVEESARIHEHVIEGKYPETKAFANGQLEVIQQHLQLAKAIQGTVKE